MSQLSTTAQVKQGARQLLSVATDKVKLASANVQRGDTLGLDVAVIKATTSQFHVTPKEKHVRTLKGAVHPEQGFQANYVIKELVKRLHQATDWLTALKTLMVIHRLMRECDITFIQQLLKYSDSEKHMREQQQRGAQGHVLNLDNFIDTTNIEGRFEFSEYVRGYGKYLDEQLEVYARINFYLSPESSVEQSRMRSLNGKDLLFQLPVLQHMLTSLGSCKPTGAAARDEVIQASLLMVVKEGLVLYKIISEGIINLSDRFFDMDYLDATKGLEIYKQAVLDFDSLQAYMRSVEQIEDLRGSWQSPQLRAIPADFIGEMENYCKEAPRPFDDAKKKSPPLRRGKAGGKARAPRDPLVMPVVPSDPGMVGAFTKAASPPAEAASSPDLLDMDSLSVSDPAPASAPPQASSNDYLQDLQPSFSTESSDPFGNASFGMPPGASRPAQPDVGRPTVVVTGAPAYNGMANGNAQRPVQSATVPAAANPFGFSQPAASSQPYSGSSYPAAQTSPVMSPPLSPAGPDMFAQLGGGISPARPPLAAAGLRKDSAVDDPFAALLGPPKVAKPQITLKQMSPASSTKSSPGFAPPTPAPTSTSPTGISFPGFSPVGQPASNMGGFGAPSPGAAPPSFQSAFHAPAEPPAPAAPPASQNGFHTSFEAHNASSLI